MYVPIRRQYYSILSPTFKTDWGIKLSLPHLNVKEFYELTHLTTHMLLFLQRYLFMDVPLAQFSIMFQEIFCPSTN